VYTLILTVYILIHHIVYNLVDTRSAAIVNIVYICTIQCTFINAEVYMLFMYGDANMYYFLLFKVINYVDNIYVYN